MHRIRAKRSTTSSLPLACWVPAAKRGDRGDLVERYHARDRCPESEDSSCSGCKEVQAVPGVHQPSLFETTPQSHRAIVVADGLASARIVALSGQGRVGLAVVRDHEERRESRVDISNRAVMNEH